MEKPQVVNDEPLGPDEIAAFLDGRLAGEDLKRLEARLADDPAARQELIRTSRILSTSPQPKKRRDYTSLPLMATLAAAAAIAFVFLRPAGIERGAGEIPIERTTATAEMYRVEIIAPDEDGDLGRLDRPLVWHSIDKATYRVVVSDSTGQTIYEGNTSDTAISIPVQLKTGARYYWSVDALVPDGSSASSGAHEFTATRR